MSHTPFAVIGLMVASGAIAHEEHIGPLEEMVVYGRAEQQIGVAHAASSGFVGYSDIQLPPLLRVGELVESVPGMVATQHSGTGKANQYFLRGFNLDHGTDFAAHAHGVPLNMRSHGHGQGYLDLNFLIPEMVATTRYRKGPYHAEVGDFSSAGSVDFRPKAEVSEIDGIESVFSSFLCGGVGNELGCIWCIGRMDRWSGDHRNPVLSRVSNSAKHSLGPQFGLPGCIVLNFRMDKSGCFRLSANEYARHRIHRPGLT